MTNHKVKCSNFEIANDKPFTLIAGPCQLENEDHALKISSELKKITGHGIILNTSFNENEPIVDTPAQAIDCFLRTDMDVLFLEKFMILDIPKS